MSQPKRNRPTHSPAATETGAPFLNEREACELLRCSPKTLRRRRLASPDALGAKEIAKSTSPHGRRYLYPAQRLGALIETPLSLDQVRTRLIAKYGLNSGESSP